MKEKFFHFNPRIIEHLGSDLITSPDVAIVELIKNSIDAHSKKVDIRYLDSFCSAATMDDFLTPYDKQIEPMIPSAYKNSSVLIIEDLGDGMSEKVLEDGFLMIGTTIKMDEKSEGNALLGEKGIGRLATQRLGNFLIVETASDEDRNTNVIAIDWSKLSSAKSIDSVKIPFDQLDKSTSHYTRLWIFEAEKSDVFSANAQSSFFNDATPDLTSDLHAAICFLVSPFNQLPNATKIRVFYNDTQVNSNFDLNYLEFSESCHEFSLQEINGELYLSLKMNLKPWVIERTHKISVQPRTSFSKYKKTFDEYNDLFEKYKGRYTISLNRQICQSDLCNAFLDLRKKTIPTKSISNKTGFEEYLSNQVEQQITELKEIAPINGKVYSFKRDGQVGGMYVDFAKHNHLKEGSHELDNYTISDLQDFLERFNGVKLYRQENRIGFLGNKDNDWIQLQQYRTLGQQFYRFNLGNTVGFVSLNDPLQHYIREISSRLDMVQNSTAIIFKEFINIVFNTYFYQLTQTADILTKNILRDEGLLPTDTSSKVKQNSKLNKELLSQNKRLLKEITRTKSLLSKEAIVEGDKVHLSANTYSSVISTLDEADTQAQATEKFISTTQEVLEEAKAGLRQIEIEAFNNYKLMANGLITETITHELHSVINGNNFENVDTHFEALKLYLIANQIAMYNNHLVPIKDHNDILVDKVSDVSDLYTFLESTFIRNNSAEDYEIINIKDTVNSVKNKLVKELRKQKVEISIIGDPQTWYMPKGVLLHVLYNLFTNSLYWIDIRKKRGLSDFLYKSNDADKIAVEQVAKDTIRIYDTGLGVIPRMEYVLFDALQSGKEREGRGMGLYIVKKLLNSFHADIDLLDERNKYGNRYIFSITVPEDCVQ